MVARFFVRPSRRSLLQAAAATLGGASLGQLGAQSSSAASHANGTRTADVKIGPFRITALLDATGQFGTTSELFDGASAEDWRQAAQIDPQAFGADDAWLLDFRCFLISWPGDRMTLFDTGIGPDGSPASSWAPVPGHIEDALASVDVTPDDIDTVVLSHLHSDHYGGSVRLDGTPVFGKAQYIVQQTEVDSLSADAAAMSYVVEPLRSSDQLRTVDGPTRLTRQESTSSLRVLPTPGHTVGHQSLVVDGGRHHLVITGDALVHAVQLVNPDVSYQFEADKQRAKQTRYDLFAGARENGAMIATNHMHVPFLAI